MNSRSNTASARQRVLHAALPLFASKGDRTRIEDISSASGVSVGSIYHHFGNRDGIVDALYAQTLSQLVQELSRATVAQRALELGGSDIDALELPEDDDMIVLENAADPEAATMMQEDDFNLTPLEASMEEDQSSGSQVIAIPPAS